MEAYLEQSNESAGVTLGIADAEKQTSRQKPDTSLMN
jgi:hypothetical protein